MGKSKTKNKSKILLDNPTSKRQQQQQQQQQNQSSNCFEGESLVGLLKSIRREIETAKLTQGNLPEKVWIKQQFCIGVNDVTRVLERMEPISESGKATQDSTVESGGCNLDSSSLQLQLQAVQQMEPISESGKSTQDSTVGCGGCKDSSSPQLQAVLLSSHCNPRWLMKHVPSLASSRGVPLIYVKDKKGGSLALGELVKLKTAIAIGIKAKGSGINKLVAEIFEKIEAVDNTELRQVG